MNNNTSENAPQLSPTSDTHPLKGDKATAAPKELGLVATQLETGAECPRCERFTLATTGVLAGCLSLECDFRELVFDPRV